VNSLKAKGAGNNYIINSIKEFLQIRVLDFIYNNKKYNQNFIFTGGTCLRLCFNLPRLSEDLDFDFVESFNMEDLNEDLNNYFLRSLKMQNITSSIKSKNTKLYLKFPILKEMSLSFGDSDTLYLKIETEPIKNAPYNTEISTISRDSLYFYIKRYSLPDLMSGKINAFLTRPFFKGKTNEIDFKGRDAFDLIWFMGQDIQPNVDRLKGLLSGSKFENLEWQEILKEIHEKFTKLKKDHLRLDLHHFLESQEIFDGFMVNYLTIFEQYYQKFIMSQGLN
jgi:hypothetical protein